MRMRTLVVGSAALIFASAGAQAAGVAIGATGEFVDEGTISVRAADIFTISNTSDAGSGVRISSLTIDISTADANADDFFDMIPHAPRFDTIDGCSPDYCYGDELGWAVTGGATSGLVGFVAYTEAEQNAAEESTAITLNFTDFDPGELFVFTTDVDDLYDFRSSGREFAFSTFSVTFVGSALPGGSVTLSDNFYADPDSLWRSVASVGDQAAVPLPAGIWLLASGLGLLAAGRRKRG